MVLTGLGVSFPSTYLLQDRTTRNCRIGSAVAAKHDSPGGFVFCKYFFPVVAESFCSIPPREF